MLGVTYTYIKCDSRTCLYHSGKNNRCNPPENENGDEEIKIMDGKCATFTRKKLKKNL